MEIKSIASITCYVKNIDATRAFYEALGFRIGEQDTNTLKVYVNWFAIQFIAQDQEEKADFQKEATAEHKGAGLYVNMKVDSADDFYKEVVAKGLKPSSEPRDWPWGNREFVIRDPDGYKLVFFQKL